MVTVMMQGVSSPMLHSQLNRFLSESVADELILRADENSLTDLEFDGEDTCMSKLRILRVSGNKLQHLDGARYPNLRTLYADNNCLSTISHCNQLRRLENLSLRNQKKGKLYAYFIRCRGYDTHRIDPEIFPFGM
jgi:Leucine-rich repeat (LRR) protein